MSAPQPDSWISPEDYLAGENDREKGPRHEYINGQVHAMVCVSPMRASMPAGSPRSVSSSTAIPGAGEWRAMVLYRERATEKEAAAYRTTLSNLWVQRIYFKEALESGALQVSPGLGLIRLILAKPEESAAQTRELIEQAGEELAWILDWVETILVRTRHARTFA